MGVGRQQDWGCLCQFMGDYFDGKEQKGDSQNECYKKTNRAKFSAKRIFLTP